MSCQSTTRFVVLFLLLAGTVTNGAELKSSQLRAGAAAVDVTPQTLPVIRNGGFIEGSANRVDDPLHARCVVLDNGETRIAIVVVDSCMMPVELCDKAKEIAVAATDISFDRITIAATHTHSAPSVMNYTLGSRADAAYTEFLPAKIAEAIQRAEKRLVPAKVGWGKTDAAGFTKNRRWITRTDRFLEDPFGERTVHAMMHPGHQNPDYVGPSGPIDPWLSIVRIDSTDDQPLALLANFSMHYFAGHPGISSDYYGRFAKRVAEELAPNDPNFVGIMSQGTSGDLWWGDYSVANTDKPFADIDQFTNGLVDKAITLCKTVETKSEVPLAMSERRLTLGRRLPNATRLAWANRKLKLMGDRRPADRPEVYAQQALYLQEHPTVEVPIQAIRIGDLGITTLPNEVYAITGLKLKAQSPLPLTFNLSLANGASGYIPPPEQHALGGYTTWPARTAGLEVEAEPKIVAALLELLEEVSGDSRKPFQESESSYSKAIVESKPTAYWRLGDMSGPVKNETSQGRLGAEGPIAFHLPGRPHSSSETHSSRSLQLAGGKLEIEGLKVSEDVTIAMYFRLGTPTDFRATTATLVEFGATRLTVTGLQADGAKRGTLQLGDSYSSIQIQQDQWYHLVVQRNQSTITVYLDGDVAVEVSALNERPFEKITIGGDATDSANFEGRIDELSVHDRKIDKTQFGAWLR